MSLVIDGVRYWRFRRSLWVVRNPDGTISTLGNQPVALTVEDTGAALSTRTLTGQAWVPTTDANGILPGFLAPQFDDVVGNAGAGPENIGSSELAEEITAVQARLATLEGAGTAAPSAAAAFTPVEVPGNRTFAAADFTGDKLFVLTSATDATWTIPDGLGMTSGKFFAWAQRGAGQAVFNRGVAVVDSALRRATFDGGTEGASVAALFDAVSAIAPTYAAAGAAEGSLGMRTPLSASQESYGAWAWASGATVCARTVITIPADFPFSFNDRVIRLMDTALTASSAKAVLTTGKGFQIRTRGATVISDVRDSAGAIWLGGAGMQYTLELRINTSTGAYALNVYPGRWLGSGAPVASTSGTATTTTFVPVGQVRVGQFSTTAVTATVFHDDIAIGTTLPLGPRPGGSSAAVPNVYGHSRSFGRYAEGSVRCDGGDEYVLSGATAA